MAVTDALIMMGGVLVQQGSQVSLYNLPTLYRERRPSSISLLSSVNSFPASCLQTESNWALWSTLLSVGVCRLEMKQSKLVPLSYTFQSLLDKLRSDSVKCNYTKSWMIHLQSVKQMGSIKHCKNIYHNTSRHT